METPGGPIDRMHESRLSGKTDRPGPSAYGTREPVRIEPLRAAKMEIIAARLTAAGSRRAHISRIISAATRALEAHPGRVRT